MESVHLLDKELSVHLLDKELKILKDMVDNC
jgi:hypothetical protein